MTSSFEGPRDTARRDVPERRAADGRVERPTERPGDPYGAAGDRRTSGSMLVGGLVMLALVVLLSWLPLIGPLLAGLAGGWIVAERRRALTVALVPAIILAVVAVLLLTAFELPVLGAIAGIGVFLFVVFQEVPLLIGAWAGGALGSNR